jgi:FKBP-type peptidyl-prolyl cis-trans isomerase FkpA
MPRTRAALIAVPVLLLSAGSSPGQVASPSPGAPATEDDKTIYAIGLMLGRQLRTFALTPAEVELVKRGLGDAVEGQPKVDVDAYQPKVQELAKARGQAAAQAEKARAQAFTEAAAKEEGAVRTPTGLVFRTIKPGAGASPQATETVQVHYVGTLTDGSEFDSSRKRGQPAEFRLNQVVKCWTEGVARMKVGETARLVCPSDIAYGDQGRPPKIPGGATLVFEVELIAIKP